MGLRKKKTLIDQASDYVEAVRPQIEAAVETAMDAAKDAAKDARDKAGPVLADARDKAGPALADARAKAAPVIAAGAALAAEKATQGRDLATAKVAQLKGEPEPKKGGKLTKILLFTGLAAAAVFVAKKLQGGGSSDNWQSSYIPAPAPVPTPVPTPPTPAAPMSGAEGVDTGGSSPDEAIADQTDAPHPVTTPDEPAEVVSINDTPGGEHKA